MYIYIISQQFMYVERGEDRVAFFKCLRKLALIRSLLRKMSCNENVLQRSQI